MPLRYALDFGVAGACIWSDTVLLPRYLHVSSLGDLMVR